MGDHRDGGAIDKGGRNIVVLRRVVFATPGDGKLARVTPIEVERHSDGNRHQELCTGRAKLPNGRLSSSGRNDRRHTDADLNVFAGRQSTCGEVELRPVLELDRAANGRIDVLSHLPNASIDNRIFDVACS
jgi:hypothetical protein